MGCTWLLFLDLPGRDLLQDLRPEEQPVTAHVPSCLVWCPCPPGASQIFCLDRGVGGGDVRICTGATGSVPPEQNLAGSFSTWYDGNNLSGQ